MKKMIATAFAAVMLVGSVSAASAWTMVSESASPKACFGQGRAEYALNGSETVGYWASARKATNATMNQDYMTACQPS